MFVRRARLLSRLVYMKYVNTAKKNIRAGEIDLKRIL